MKANVLSRWALALLLVLLVLAGPALGQIDEPEEVRGFDGRSVPVAEDEVPWIAIAYTAVLGLCCMGLTFKSPKRTHLD